AAVGNDLVIQGSAVPDAFGAVITNPAPWRTIFVALISASSSGGGVQDFGLYAQPGAQRVADAVYGALVLALRRKVVPAPARYAPRPLDFSSVDLDTVYPNVVKDGWLLLSSPSREELYQVVQVGQTSRTDFALTGSVTRVGLAGNGLDPI